MHFSINKANNPNGRWLAIPRSKHSHGNEIALQQMRKTAPRLRSGELRRRSDRRELTATQRGKSLTHTLLTEL